MKRKKVRAAPCRFGPRGQPIYAWKDIKKYREPQQFSFHVKEVHFQCPECGQRLELAGVGNGHPYMLCLYCEDYSEYRVRAMQDAYDIGVQVGMNELLRSCENEAKSKTRKAR